MTQSKIRVRFAPSPTGPLHIGGVRTALYNYLFAKKLGGTFILRIEDTDQTRFVSGAEEYIIDALTWCGITFDEGVHLGGPFAPYRQSDRKNIYQTYAQQLIDNGWAYYAFDSADDLDKLRSEHEAQKKTFTYDASIRKQLNNSLNLGFEKALELISQGVPYVVRFKMPENEIVKMDDLIREHIEVNTSTLDDKVLFKSDGMPTYHLANVVDDHLMEISHVIRGEEWLPSMPLHVLLYRAFGWSNTMPQFAHLPLLLKPEGNGKLSKRDGDRLGFPVFPTQWNNPETGEKSSGYREEGYIPQAFINMMAFLGWNPGTEQELFSLEELGTVFSLERVNKAGARFDPEKAKWFNQQYLRLASDESLLPDIKAQIADLPIQHGDNILLKILNLVKERMVFTKDFLSQADYFFSAPSEYDESTVKKRWKEDSPSQMIEVCSIIEKVEDFSAENLEQLVKSWIEEKELNMGAIMNAFRLCIVGAAKGPHLFDILAILGKEECVFRLRNAVKCIK